MNTEEPDPSKFEEFNNCTEDKFNKCMEEIRKKKPEELTDYDPAGFWNLEVQNSVSVTLEVPRIGNYILISLYFWISKNNRVELIKARNGSTGDNIDIEYLGFKGYYAYTCNQVIEFRNHIASLLSNDSLADVTFKVGKDLKEVKAHRFILVARRYSISILTKISVNLLLIYCRKEIHCNSQMLNFSIF